MTRTRARAIAQQLRDQPDRAVLRVAVDHYAAGDVWLAYEILRAAPRALTAATRAHLTELSTGMASWSHVDSFASFVSGVAWRLGRIDDATIAAWTKSGDRWRRRAALVSTVPLNCRARGATAPRGDAQRTCAVCLRLLDDRDDMVVKAMSWALRELAKRDARAVRAFLRRHGDRLAPRVRREVTNKLSTGLKTPRSPKPR